MADVDLAQRSRELEEGMLRIGKKMLTLKDVFIYSLLVFAIFALGAMNWATMSFDFSALSWGYVAHSLVQIFAYGAIITAFGIQQLDRRKVTSKQLAEVKYKNNRIVNRHRPEQLKEYIFRENQDSKRDAFIDKYQQKLTELEDQHEKSEGYFALEKQWREYRESLRENKKLPEEEQQDIEPPNDYCAMKERYLERIHNPDEYFEDENVEYEKIEKEDLTNGVRRSSKRRIPRGSEGTGITMGVTRNIAFMVAWSFLTAGIFLGASEGGLNAVVKTVFTVILALWSAFKGLAVGERVFENITLEQELWRNSHLHGYAVMEATENNYNIYAKE